MVKGRNFDMKNVKSKLANFSKFKLTISSLKKLKIEREETLMKMTNFDMFSRILFRERAQNVQN